MDVDSINQKELDKNPNESHMYFMSSLGKDVLITSLKRSCLAPQKLELKKGALVMFVRNNYDKGYVNGTLGKVASFDHNNDPIVHIFDGKKITVTPETWSIRDDDKIIAQLTQHPLRLAWAITIHKSQGMTLSAAEIDLSKSFVEGMGYVALSRVQSLSGIKLLGYNDISLRVNQTISEIDETLQELSIQTAQNLKKLSFLTIFLKKRKFMYQLTS